MVEFRLVAPTHAAFDGNKAGAVCPCSAVDCVGLLFNVTVAGGALSDGQDCLILLRRVTVGLPHLGADRLAAEAAAWTLRRKNFKDSPAVDGLARVTLLGCKKVGCGLFPDGAVKAVVDGGEGAGRALGAGALQQATAVHILDGAAVTAAGEVVGPLL